MKTATRIELFALLALALPVVLHAQGIANLSAQPEANLSANPAANPGVTFSVYIDPATNPGESGGGSRQHATVQAQQLRQRSDAHYVPPSLASVSPAPSAKPPAPKSSGGFSPATTSSFGSSLTSHSSLTSPLVLAPYPTHASTTSRFGRPPNPVTQSSRPPRRAAPHAGSRAAANAAITPNP